jgi:hypothetical protein
MGMGKVAKEQRNHLREWATNWVTLKVEKEKQTLKRIPTFQVL